MGHVPLSAACGAVLVVGVVSVFVVCFVCCFDLCFCVCVVFVVVSAYVVEGFECQCRLVVRT